MHAFGRFRQLFRYDDWANGEVIASLRVAGSPPVRSLKLIGHILGAEYVWLSRIKTEKSPLAIWPDLSIQDCERYAHDLATTWPAYLSHFDESQLAKKITYQNSKGESWSNSLEDILTHVIMHSAYHRGQIASDMRAAGLTPVYTDFIHGIRQGLME